jgi:hypothetical protein
MGGAGQMRDGPLPGASCLSGCCSGVGGPVAGRLCGEVM